MSALFSLHGRVAVVTGASGAIGGAIARGFAEAGADLALTYGGNRMAAEAVAHDASEIGRKAHVATVDILDGDAMARHAADVVEAFGRIDVLVNCAGGNVRAAITDAASDFFDLPIEAVRRTMDVNFIGGAVLPCQHYGARIAANDAAGAIINISSMNAFRPLEGRPAYAAAKAAVSNFTQWLACHVAERYTPALRVNAIAPGFFPNERMRDALFDADGTLSARGRKIIDHTPMHRLGNVDDLVGTAIWYASDASRFVTGTVTPVDGGFNAYAGL